MDASQKLGQKLLQGWTMLGESCSSCNAPLMRSRDGTQTICVVCVPKPESPVIMAESPVEKTHVEEILSEEDEPAYLPESELAHIKQLEREKRQNYPFAITNSLLKSLNYSLKSNQSIQVFSDILESALNPLKSFQLKKDGLGKDTIAAIEDKIVEKITFNSSDHKAVISYFNSVDRLIKLYNEFKQVTK